MKDNSKRFLSLTMVQSTYSLKGTITICFSLCLIQLGVLFFQLKHAVFEKTPDGKVENLMPWSYRFEEFLARSRWDIFFYVAFFSLVILLCSITVRQWNQSNVEYTYKRLPVPRYFYPLSLITNNLISIMFFYSIQFATLFAGNLLYQTLVPENLRMTQSLFLALLRWDFLNSIFPLFNGMQMIRLVLCILAIAVVTMLFSYHLARRDYPLFLGALFLGCLITFQQFQTIWKTLIWCLVLVFTVLSLTISYRNLKKLD